MTRSITLLLVAFALLVSTLAAVQFSAFRDLQPAPDSIEYFEVADRIQRVGYAHGMSLHWSPLYPVYLLAARAVAGSSLDREPGVTAAADAVLLVSLCATVAAVFLSLGRLCFPDRQDLARAWLACACGLAAYFAFSVLRVGLRMPDALVTCLAVVTLWAWCIALARGLDLRWSATAGLLSGGAFLARANLLHWSLVVALAACILARRVTGGRRLAAYAVFVTGLLTVVGPQVYALSSARGVFTFGESGKLVFAETYGAVWPNGESAWPVKISGGDVRVFTETRNLNFPGFFEPGREYDDATIPVRWTKTILTVVRSARATLFGYWSPSFALMWPILWALWPALVFGVGSLRPAHGIRSADEPEVLRQRIGWLLIAAGSAGIAMHLLSFSLGYYLPPYLIPLFGGLYLKVLDHDTADRPGERLRRRAAWIVAAGFIVSTTLTTANGLRRSDDRDRSTGAADTRAVAAALSAFPVEGGGRRRVAVAGGWLGLYAIRLSNSQVVADLPHPDVLHDPVRGAGAIRALRDLGVVALLIPRSEAEADDVLRWRAVTSAWAIADLRAAQPSRGAR